MPKKYSVTLLGHNVEITGPATFAELSEIVGEESALETAVLSQVYRAYAPRVRDAYFTNIEHEFGVKLEPEVPATTNGDGKTIAAKWPTDRKSQKQLADKAGTNDPVNTFQNAMEKAVADTDFNEALKGAERQGGQIGKEWLEIARAGMQRVQEEKGGSYDDFLAAMRTLLPGVTLPEEPTEEDVARILKRYNEAEKKNAATSKF